MSAEPHESENGHRIRMDFLDFRGIFNMAATLLNRHEMVDEGVLTQHHFANAE
jgi:hypothetical protein